MDSSMPTASYLETMHRLSAKPSVRATVLLERTRKTVLQTSGDLTWLHAPSKLEKQFQSIASPETVPIPVIAEDSNQQKEQGIQELAAMVLRYVDATDGFVEGLDSEDSLKLLRLRTKKHELVIVPDPKYIFVVVTDPSSS